MKRNASAVMVIVAGSLGMSVSTGCSLKMSDYPSRDHVLILPGIIGGPLGTNRLKKDLDALPDVSTQIWDWRWYSGRVIGSLEEDESTRRAGIHLADAISDWKTDHSDTRLHIVAISGASLVTWIACKCIGAIESGDLETITILSGSMESWRDPAPLRNAVRRGVFNYSQQEDWALKLLNRPSIGIEGFKNPEGISQNTVETRSRFGTDAHVGCLKAPYIRDCLLPIITSNASGWPSRCRDE